MDHQLAGRIAEAFRGVARPRKITKSVARALDDDPDVSPDRMDELRTLDREQQWTDLSDGEIEKYDDIFPFLDAEGYLFYLPAFMSYALRRFEDSDSCALDAPIFACAAGVHRMSMFSPKQIEAAIGFLDFCANHGERFEASWARYAVQVLKSRG